MSFDRCVFAACTVTGFMRMTLAKLVFDDDATYVAGAREAGLSAHPVSDAGDVRIGLAVHQLER